MPWHQKPKSLLKGSLLCTGYWWCCSCGNGKFKRPSQRSLEKLQSRPWRYHPQICFFRTCRLEHLLPGVKWATIVGPSWIVLFLASSTLVNPCPKESNFSIYEEGAKIFGHSPSHHKILSVTSRRTAHSISLINEKNTLLIQIASMSNLVQKGALEQLLSQVKSKIKLLRRSENGRKKRWKFKKAQAAFRSNPYRAGKSLLDPKCSTTLQVEQSVLDSHKSSSVSDKFFDIPLRALEGLPESPSISK